MRFTIHLKPVEDKDLGDQVRISKYLRSKNFAAALFHDRHMIKFEASNPGIIKHLKQQFGDHIVCILSDKAGAGKYKRPDHQLTSGVKVEAVLKERLHLDPKGLFGPKAVPLTPMAVAKAYNFPQPKPAIKDKVVAILELGGGFKASDVLAYCKQQNVAYPRLWQHNYSTGQNAQDGASGADGEVSLDIDVVAAVAPGAQILICFAPNTTNGFIDAIYDVANYFKRPDALSISWGAPLSSWSADEQAAMNNAIKACVDKGINVFVAAGDDGSSDGAQGNNVDFPAASPYAIACGGTKLILNKDGSRHSEVVWNEQSTGEGATGGGIAPDGRKVPDIAGNADPQSGYIVSVDGQQMSIGGTSAVAPLMAALNVILNSHLDEPIKNLREAFYANPSVFFDVTIGNNGAYKASVGYDCCTGLGVPDGTKLLNVFKPTAHTKLLKFLKQPIGDVLSSVKNKLNK